MKNLISVLNCGEAAEFLQKFLSAAEGNALLTVGSKELKDFSGLPAPLKQRLYARVLPSSQVIESCEKLGFDAGHIIAMKGPFTKAMNKATLEMTDSHVLVTKDGGAAGGLEEKLAAALELGTAVLMVRRPEENGMTAGEAIRWGGEILKGYGAPPHAPLPKRDRSGCHSLRSWAVTRKGLGPLRIPFFPFFTDIAGRAAVVVGGGKVAARRVKTLLACGACVTVISPSFGPAFGGAEFEKIKRCARPYRKDDIADSAVLAVAATDERGVNRQVGLDAKALGIPVSVADAQDECTFLFPSLIEWGGAAAAVSTGGRSPSLCRRLADRLRSVWPAWVEEMREKILEKI